MANQREGPVIVAGHGCAAVLGEDVPSLALALRGAMESPEPLAEVVLALAGSLATGLPAFAIIFPEAGHARVLVRGDLVVCFADVEGDMVVASADGLSTWTEKVVPMAPDVVVSGPGTRVHLVLLPGASSAIGSAIPAVPSVAQADPISPDLIGEGEFPEIERAATAAPGPVVPATEPDPGETIFPGALAATASSTEPAPPLSVKDPNGEGETVFREPRRTQGSGPDSTMNPPAGTPPTEPPTAPADRIGVREPAPGGVGFIEAVPRRPLPGAAAAANPGLPTNHHPPSGEDDGLTVSAARLRKARAPQGKTLVEAGTLVQAVRCPAGHVNPPHVDCCRLCSAPIANREVAMVERPSLGRLRFDDGLVVELDRTVVLGRKPSPGSLGERAVTVPDRERTLSRNHAEVRVVDWQVLVVDRGSTNGTCVEVPGQLLTQLRPDEPFLVPEGTVVILGDVVRFVYEVNSP